MAFKYTPDDDTKVHEEGAIRLICGAFKSHDNGLPEWLKNASDAYLGSDASPNDRIIVVILQTGRKGNQASISCLDFVGMTSHKIENDFRVWADPEAARRGGAGARAQGGHGNGGKCYMTQMFDGGSFMTTLRASKACRYGVAAGSVKFGYAPDRQSGRDFPVSETRALLADTLSGVGTRLNRLPPDALRLAEIAQGFTLLSGIGPKGYGPKFPVTQLVADLEEHPQMLRTLEICRVYVMVDGEPFDAGRQLRLPDIAPLEGADGPRIVPIPTVLADPTTGLKIPTGDSSGKPGQLTLLTSATSMRWSKKHRHVITYQAHEHYVGYVPVPSLDVASPFRDRLYGSCELDSLEAIKQNDRGLLADSPLRRALEHWIAERLQAYAKEFEARDRQRHNQEEQNALSKMNEALDQWKNRLLRDILKELWGPGSGGPEPRRLPTGKVNRIEVRLSHSKAGLGVAFRPTIHFFSANGTEVAAVPYHWQSENNNVAMVDDELMVVTTFTYGTTDIWAQTLDGKLRSNRVPLEVVRLLSVRLEPLEMKLNVGARQRIEALCTTPGGELRDEAYLVWTESNSSVARVSGAGQVFAFSPGTTEITAGDDKVEPADPVKLTVLTAEPAREGKGKGGKGDKKGGGSGRSGFPLVLVSGIQNDPETDETINFSRDDPPVHQRPQDVDRNIWWINSSAPFAALYLSADKGYGYTSREWRIYHLERYIDVLVQIAITNDPANTGTVPVDEWIMKWGAMAAEIQSAAVSSLRSFIDEGALPEGSSE